MKLQDKKLMALKIQGHCKQISATRCQASRRRRFGSGGGGGTAHIFLPPPAAPPPGPPLAASAAAATRPIIHPLPPPTHPRPILAATMLRRGPPGFVSVL